MEPEDEFYKYYKQYRRFDNQDVNSISSAGTMRYPASQYSNAVSDNSSFCNTSSTNNNTFGSSKSHKKLQLKSKSLGRDPRMVDLNNYYRRLEEFNNTSSPQPNNTGYNGEDCMSRDSGHSSAGTPELIRTNIFGRGNSCPSPNSVRNEGSVIGGFHPNFPSRYGGGNRYGLDDTQSLYSFTARSTAPSNYGGYRGMDVASYHGDSHIKDYDDTMSIRSLDAHLQNWNRAVSRDRNAKRKYDSFSEEEDDCLGVAGLCQTPKLDEPATKRPRTPSVPEQTVQKDGLTARLLRGVLKLTSLYLIIVFLIVSAIFVYELVNEYQCGQKKEMSIDLMELENSLNTSLFGQNIAQQEVMERIQEFTELASSQTISSIKPILVLLLVGWTGTGKTHTSNLVAASFPIPGNIHRLAGASINTNPILQELPKMIQRSCGFSLIIADDVPDNKAITAKLENLIFSLNSDEEGKGNGSVIIISTTTGGHLINRFLLDRVQAGSEDQNLMMAAGNNGVMTSNNNNVIASAVSSVSANLLRKHIADQGLDLPLQSFLKEYSINHEVIPYLPLTRESVRLCILAELRESKSSLSKVEVSKIMDQIPFFSPHLPIFSKVGCKKVAAKVMLALRMQPQNIEL